MTTETLKELALFYAWLMSQDYAIPSDDPLVQSMVARWLVVRDEHIAADWKRSVPRRQGSFTGSNSNG